MFQEKFGQYSEVATVISTCIIVRILRVSVWRPDYGSSENYGRFYTMAWNGLKWPEMAWNKVAYTIANLP